MKRIPHSVKPARWFALVLLCAYGVQVAAAPCDEAWAAYNEFTSRTVMEPSQYALTVQGAQVRAACGANALPAPAGSDVPRYRHHVRPVSPRTVQPTPVPPAPVTRPQGLPRAP
jgi:hypothetical protein